MTNESFYLYLNAGAMGSFWELKDTLAVKYKTEGLKSYKLDGAFGYSGIPIATVDYESPLDSYSERQNDLIGLNKTQTAGIEKFTAGIKLDGLIYSLYPDLPYWTKKAFTARLKYIQEAFYVNATAQEDYKISNGGDSVAFKTVFKENEITISLAKIGGISELTQHDVRVGYYDIEWTRPIDYYNSYTYTPEGRRVVLVDFNTTNYKSKGIALKLEAEDKSAPGKVMDLGFLYGIDNNVSDEQNWRSDTSNMSQILNQDSLKFFSVTADFLYNWYLSKYQNIQYDGFFVTFGVSFDWKRFYYSDMVSVAEERLYKVYTNIGYRL